ncbi:MarR family transcriptional regulator [Dehalobacter sp. DCM]|uniref:MarR family transcriptional regulator n=1 Tax=Dehalobacter sp. DCM TaxID=2907827 RepID=UPI0030819A34|nr:MarR family transcriptional regulator [Dehalobacter sp. DCM]
MNEIEQQAFIFGNIFVLANRLQVLGDAFDKNITIKQWLFLACVAQFKSAPTVSEVAEHIGYSRQNAKRMADALEQREFVRIVKDNTDARALRIHLTPKFNDYFESRRQKEVAFIQNLFHGFDLKLTSGLYQGLIQLTENMITMEKENAEVKE